MAKVLERRNENWRTLHDYILSERETFQILGPGGIPLAGLRREFHWFIRDGYLVRSPVKANGASLGERIGGSTRTTGWRRSRTGRSGRRRRRPAKDKA